jgi:hypothetical protein
MWAFLTSLDVGYRSHGSTRENSLRRACLFLFCGVCAAIAAWRDGRTIWICLNIRAGFSRPFIGDFLRKSGLKKKCSDEHIS